MDYKLMKNTLERIFPNFELQCDDIVNEDDEFGENYGIPHSYTAEQFLTELDSNGLMITYKKDNKSE